MLVTLNPGEEAQLRQTIEMFEVITQSQPHDYQSLEILKEAYLKLDMQKEVIQTSKRIAQAYVQLGQLSSAILEYETILQRDPDDVDSLAAMAQIEHKAHSLAAPPPPPEIEAPLKLALPSSLPAQKAEPSHSDIDDGRQMMFKLFVEGKLLTQVDFDSCWNAPSLNDSPAAAVEPFIHNLAEKSIIPIDKSLNLLSERSRLAYLPLERYEIDIETARTFPKDVCRRWCVVPFDRMSKSVLVATANPFNRQAISDLERATKSRLVWFLAPPADMIKVLGKIFR